MRKPTKTDVGTFLGMLGVALLSTIINKFNTESAIKGTVEATLAEERRQILEYNKQNDSENNGSQE